MSTLLRILFGLVLLAVAGFCVFGFMATYEPPADLNMPLRVIYGVAGIGCLAGAVWLAKPGCDVRRLTDHGEFEQMLTRGRCHWLIAFNHNEATQSVTVELTHSPENSTLHRTLTCHPVARVESRWHGSDDQCLEGLIAAHEARNALGYHYLLVTDQREIEFHSSHKVVIKEAESDASPDRSGFVAV